MKIANFLSRVTMSGDCVVEPYTRIADAILLQKCLKSSVDYLESNTNLVHLSTLRARVKSNDKISS